MRGKKQIFQNRGRFDIGRNADEHAEQQCLVNDGLIDVENLNVGLPEDFRQRGGDAGAVFTGDVEQENGLGGIGQGAVIVGGGHVGASRLLPPVCCGLFRRMAKVTWDKDRIVTELARLHKNGTEISYNKLAKSHQSLVSAAAYHFGSYRKAIEKAGVDYAEVTRRPRWTKQGIIKLIKGARRKGEDLHWAAVTRRGDELELAAFASLQPRLFGRWDKALQSAGLDADDVALYRKWDRGSILFELRGLARDKEPLNSGALQISEPGLHAAAVRHFGGYESALRAAKLDPADYRQRRRWTKAVVIEEMRSLFKGPKKLTMAELRADHSALYGAAVRLFGGISEALTAAKLKKPS